jgi:BirA family transcriptional regulator, biotin operon repressor / biotin---[acetyl-CoA-carboxylase] ligase
LAIMSELPEFPPLYRPFAVTPELDPFERCLKIAADGAEAGTLLWSIGQEACECAVVLAPEQSLEASLPVVLIAMLALGDALGSLVPPLVAVTFGWPDRIEVNGRVVGGVRMASAPGNVPSGPPEWLVIGFGIALRPPSGEGEPGEHGHRTTLADEGCGEVGTVDLLEAFARHFLAWINRWQEDGVGPVVRAWMSRATGLGKPVEIEVGGHKRQGTFTGLAESGAMRLVKDGVTQTISLDEAIRAPSWSVWRGARPPTGPA